MLDQLKSGAIRALVLDATLLSYISATDCEVAVVGAPFATVGRAAAGRPLAGRCAVCLPALSASQPALPAASSAALESDPLRPVPPPPWAVLCGHRLPRQLQRHCAGAEVQPGHGGAGGQRVSVVGGGSRRRRAPCLSWGGGWVGASTLLELGWLAGSVHACASPRRKRTATPACCMEGGREPLPALAAPALRAVPPPLHAGPATATAPLLQRG